MADQNWFGQAWGAFTDGVGQALNDAVGIRPEGFYKQRTNPQTGKLEYESAPGVFTPVPDRLKTTEMIEAEGAGRRKVELSRNKEEVQALRNADQRFTLTTLAEQQKPVLLQLQQAGQLQGQQIQLQRDQLNMERQARIDDLTRQNKIDQANLELQRFNIEDRRLERQDAIAARDREYNLGLAQLQYTSDLARHNQIMNAFGSLGRGLAAVL